ncbi:putative c3hc4 type (ring finger) zinc finger containing protein [Diaporthe ampelina]|uniref:E3 ubiquitin-protein ligase listerin n=1 Tax=Diaporthe ampelina TaxID=1214573 RepID=A0A0G2FWF3_9PEZI|nr:putative c3hc4 type (ring finger) zinc finger containing protein [Diaporthe ampelina]
MSSKGAKGRVTGGRGFGSPVPSSFGGFITQSTSSGSLSYLSEDPDLSSLSDPNIVVSFKNLLKKDNTTKSKALADLIQYTQGHPNETDGGVEEAVLEAWVRLYPRMSTDNDRRVRELSHTLQFELLKSARKRMEKNLPKVAGSWLAGTYDKDKAVARSATEGISTFLNTEDKMSLFWKKCQAQILQFATDAITETPDTLSDERSTKPEDAEAKYYRVIAASFSLILGLLGRLSGSDVEKYGPEYEAFFTSGPGDSAWTFAAADDAHVRRTVYQLLQLCVESHWGLIQPHASRIGKILTSDALKKSQLGSAADFVATLTTMTRKEKEFWGTKKSPLALGAEWDRLAEVLVARISNSLPEVSKEFETSQRKIAEDGTRWFSVVSTIQKDIKAVLKQNASDEIPDRTQGATQTVIRNAADLLRRRNYKPFGAAAILQSAIKLTPQLFNAGNAPYLESLIPTESDVLARPLAQENIGLQEYIKSRVLASPSLQDVCSQLVEALNSENESSITALEIILKHKPTSLSENEALQLTLVTKLLSMMELTDSTVASRATQLRSILEGHVDAQPSILSIIQDNLERPGPDSLVIDTLVRQATPISKTDEVDLEQLFPNTNIWMQELLKLLPAELSPSLAMTSNVLGAYFLPQASENKSKPRIQRDQRGMSIPARMAMYTVALVENGAELGALAQKFQAELLYLLYLVVEVTSDQITLMDENLLFDSLRDPSLLKDVEDFVTTTRNMVNNIFTEPTHWRPGGAEKGLRDELIDIMVQQSRELTPIALYSARALSEILAAFSDAHGQTAVVEEWLTAIDVMKATPSTVFPAVALLTGYGEALANSKLVSNLLNRLVSDIAGASPHSDKTMLTLVLLNACMPIYELGQLPVANNRLVFAVKQITSWAGQPIEGLSVGIVTESCRALQRLLPCIREVYGPYWEQAIEFCLSSWKQAGRGGLEKHLPYIHTSVKLMSGLAAIEDPNDDLVDALETHEESRNHALLELLKLPRAEANSQPQAIVDALLCRQAERIPLDHLKDLSEVYGLVASESRDTQSAGFNLLHRALPAAQEDLSLDVLIEKKQATLPDELMSLLLDAPTLEAYPEEILIQFPTAIRSYLLSWKLIFDAYQGSAHKLREDYTEQLKTLGAINPLMEFTVDVLGHSAAHAINLDKMGFTAEDIQDYDIKVGDSLPDEKNMQWLLVHLFYLSLKYVPGLFKTWFIDCRSRQTKNAVEPWTAKWFSPILIRDVMEEVETWSKSQVADPDEHEFVIKVNQKAREITAAYPIDDGDEEQSASLLLQINANFPIGNVNVLGLNRVACNERTWQSWVRTTQGIIIISNGSIIEGLGAFRRNVVGALKGNVECAICYSYISVDKRMPDKRCATCKNLFHRDCLYKWLESANQNTCPLCRTRMDFVDKKKPRRNV